jgi:hypothetical protein
VLGKQSGRNRTPIDFMIAVRLIYAIAAMVVVSLNTTACGVESDRTVRRAQSLVVADGNRVVQIDVATKTVTDVKDYGRQFVVDHLNLVATDTLILDVCHVTAGCTIRALSISTGDDKVLGIGRGVTVEPSTRVAYFFDQSQTGTTSLYTAPLSELTKRRKIVDVRPSTTLPPQEAVDPEARAVTAPAGQLVFVGPDRALWSYDTNSDTQRPLGIRDCSPVLIRTRTGELVCANLLERKWYLVNLARHDKTEIGAASGAYSAVYESQSDLLFFGFPRIGPTGERTDIVELHFDSSSPRLFLEHQFFSTGIAIR